ncbi:MAG TPA: LamG-like jellyroll fold domain-containing protein [Solirubrobacteraceae bacterium]|nr:LamG-like jellyroll fold domain-containing protein [Solirubrobacteraceae bacterium]
MGSVFSRRTSPPGAGARPAGGRGARRGSRIPHIALVAIISALTVGAATAGPALADTANLLPNGNFEGTDGTGSLSGWRGTNLTLADDGVGGGYAGRVADTSTATGYGLYAYPKPVTSTVQGTMYSAGGEIRSDTPGKTVCLQLHEISSAGTTIGGAQQCATTTSSWTALPTVTYTAQQSGNAISFQVRQTQATSGDSFEADNLTLTAASPTIVAQWNMDETSGTTMYDSVGSNNGTLYSVTLGLPGFTGTAYGFDGAISKGYVAVPSAPDLNPGTSYFAFTIHVKTTTRPAKGDYDIMRKGVYSTTVSPQEYKMEIQQSGQASCAFRGTTGHAQIIAGPSVTDGVWHTLGCSMTATGITLTVDGQSFTKNVRIGSLANTSPLVMGAHPGFDYYNGLLDDASVTEG